MARVAYTPGMALSIYDSAGEVNYYIFGESTFNGGSGPGAYAKIVPNFRILSIDEINFTTTIRVYLDVKSTGASGSGSAVKGYINGNLLPNTFTQLSANQSIYMGSLDITIYHDKTTGAGSTSVECFVDSAWNGLNDAKSTTTLYMNTMATASTMSISSSTFVIGKDYSLTINSQNDNFKHKIAVFLDTGYTSSGTVNNPGYVIYEDIYTSNKVRNLTAYAPSQFYDYLYGKKYGTGRIVLYTQTSNGTSIGNAYSLPITIYVDEDASRPTINTTVSMTDYSSLTGSKTTLINGYSDVSVDVSATAKNNSVISSYTIKNGNKVVNADSAYFENVSSGVFTAIATDNRGLSSVEVKKEYNIVPYVGLTLNVKAERENQTSNKINITVSGKYWKHNFGATDNIFGLIIRHKRKGASNWASSVSFIEDVITFDTTNNTYSYTYQITNYDYKTACEIEVVVSDLLDSKTSSKIVSEGIPIVAFAQKLVEFFGKKVFFKDNDGNCRINTDLIYPVGSIYMSVNSTNPSTLFGGSWERIAQGRALMGEGVVQANNDNWCGTTNAGAWTAYAGLMGGEVFHTLSVGEIPAHSHGYSGTTSGAGSHNHSSGTQQARGGTSSDNYTLIRPYGWSSGPDGTQTATNTVDNHTHTYSGTTSNTGSSWGHNNMPPYLVVYIWKRIS